MLKQYTLDAMNGIATPAAFGRLCVETIRLPVFFSVDDPAAFGRLCVETLHKSSALKFPLPAAFGRLCVETIPTKYLNQQFFQPPSGGCVLKQAGHSCRCAGKFQPPSGGCVLKLLHHNGLRR